MNCDYCSRRTIVVPVPSEAARVLGDHHVGKVACGPCHYRISERMKLAFMMDMPWHERTKRKWRNIQYALGLGPYRKGKS